MEHTKTYGMQQKQYYEASLVINAHIKKLFFDAGIVVQ